MTDVSNTDYIPLGESGTPLHDNDRFVLGEINAVVKSLPARMDRFEAATSSGLADIRREFSQNVNGINNRVMILEQGAARHSGISTSLMTFVTIVATLVSSLISGLIAFFLGKHT